MPAHEADSREGTDDWERCAGALSLIDDAITEHEPSHVFAMFSGGHDSLAATAIAAQHPRFTAAVHINTGIGIEQTRELVRATCREQGWPLLEYGPPELSYEQMVLEHGFPGPAGHGMMYARLKERSLRKLVREHKRHRRDKIALVTGMRAGESVRRLRAVASSGPVHLRGVYLWVNPIHDWETRDCHDLLDAYGLQRNPVVDVLHMSGECLCGAFARPGEIEELELWFPDTAVYIHELERRVEAAGRPGCVWGQRPPRVNRQQLQLAVGELCSSCVEAA